MKIIFMGRKKQSAELLKWTVAQGIEIVAVCTDSQFENSPTARTAREMNIPVLSMEEAEERKKALDAVAARASQLETEVSRLQHDLIAAMSEGEEANGEITELKKLMG